VLKCPAEASTLAFVSAEVDLPATDGSRRFGYLIWPKRLDAEMSALLGEPDSCEVVFDGRNLGEKRIDWKHRRISVGPSQTRGMDARVAAFRVRSLGAQGAISVSFTAG
jgi:hypothetical protein